MNVAARTLNITLVLQICNDHQCLKSIFVQACKQKEDQYITGRKMWWLFMQSANRLANRRRRAATLTPFTDTSETKSSLP